MNEFKRLNEKYNDDTYDTFPFISPNKITPIKKGLYKKHNTKYRGITALYDVKEQRFRFFLYGMYRIKEDIVVVPDTIEMTDTKQVLLDAAIASGYIRVSKLPKFDPIEFPPDSYEAKLALANRAMYHFEGNKKSLDINNSTL